MENIDSLPRSKCAELREQFENWYENNRDTSWTKELLPCPTELALRRSVSTIQPTPNATGRDRPSESRTQDRYQRYSRHPMQPTRRKLVARILIQRNGI